MKAVNLFLLTRQPNHETISSLYQALTCSEYYKAISPHEAASLCMLTNLLADRIMSSPDHPANWADCFDGFFFSYMIDHIGKEFDLLKFSSDGEYALNIELKSEDIGEERIKKQLEQNRYYLSNAIHKIYSFTYVMSTGVLYTLNDRNHMRQCSVDELTEVMCRPAFRDHLTEGIDRFFRSSDYLISPVAAPERFLQGQYFLTNQQYQFKQMCLEHIQSETAPVVSITGMAGTGKTLLLFDLAVSLSKKNRVLFLHAGRLRAGHHAINTRLKNVDILAGESYTRKTDLSEYSFLMIDEADYLSAQVLKKCLTEAGDIGIPVILAYDPHQLLNELFPEEQKTEQEEFLKASSTLSLAFSGNIRINRPAYSFLRTLLYLKDRSGHPDYSCIDVLYADNPADLNVLIQYHTDRGYQLITKLFGREREDTVIAQEYYKVIMVLNENCYYDDSSRLCVTEQSSMTIRLLYEGFSRTREKLALVVAGNRKLYEQLLSIRLHRLPFVDGFT
jgi:hypothetical protein